MGKLSRFAARLRQFIERLRRFSENDGMPFIRNAWCGIFRDTDHPCEEAAVCIMHYKNQFGFAEAVFLCERHHPEKNTWTKRHFELKGCHIISVKDLAPLK